VEPLSSYKRLKSAEPKSSKKTKKDAIEHLQSRFRYATYHFQQQHSRWSRLEMHGKNLIVYVRLLFEFGSIPISSLDPPSQLTRQYTVTVTSLNAQNNLYKSSTRSLDSGDMSQT